MRVMTMICIMLKVILGFNDGGRGMIYGQIVMDGRWQERDVITDRLIKDGRTEAIFVLFVIPPNPVQRASPIFVSFFLIVLMRPMA